MRRAGTIASEKRVLRVMREEELRPAYAKRRRRSCSSYAGEASKAADNLANRDFHTDEPNRLWLTDRTEFRLPAGPKVYLSPVIDRIDGKPMARSIGVRPTAELANSSLARARTVIHSDRGEHYR
jgi:putative transposase